MAERFVPRHTRTVHADEVGLFVRLRSTLYRPLRSRPTQHAVGDRVIAVPRKSDPSLALVGTEEWQDEEADGE